MRSLEIRGVENFSGSVSFASQFALACHHWKIPAADAVQGFIWAWLENQIAAATKLVPLGQTQAQKLLVCLMKDIPPIAEKALQLPDEDIGWSLPGVVMASAKHERQYSRLFRS
jgi:urease accessory protein